MAAEQKVVATVLSKGASSVLIFFVTLTLILFLVLRVFTIDRVIQMNMEIAILAGHLVLIFPSTPGENEIGCKIVSIALHLFFLACFMFMMLEAVHMYTLVAYVVKKDGLFDRKVNLAIGWGVAVFIVGVSVGFEWAHYGAAYQ
ncbi:hypothetical protein HAZT_HAZT003172 [Hyalella azteca]|uniref:G-protein coupled receptors family 2 profile 2 domain-containing protein n=1 Tax=Hyalella azteca TaxID=294128 RepID=A0A6A0GZY9_HYAAZ|nr:hypothetical protein HAZT_HAZT003172 [Hyalella azteca]